MKRNSIIEMPNKYQTPRVVEVTFDPEGFLLTLSQVGSGGGEYGEGDFDIDF